MSTKTNVLEQKTLCHSTYSAHIYLQYSAIQLQEPISSICPTENINELIKEKQVKLASF